MAKEGNKTQPPGVITSFVGGIKKADKALLYKGATPMNFSVVQVPGQK